MAEFYHGLLFLGRKCLHATSQKRALLHAISLAVNYGLFSHGDVSYRFNGKNDNVVLEFSIDSHFVGSHLKSLAKVKDCHFGISPVNYSDSER